MTDARPIGAWSSDDLLETVRAQYGMAADADLAPELRMLSAVARVGAKRAALEESADASPAVFLLRPTVPEEMAGSAVFVPMVDAGLEQLGGRIWFVAEVVLAGRYVPLSSSNDAELFAHVTAELGCGSIAAVIFDPRTSPATLRFYPLGLEDPDRCAVVRIDAGAEIDLGRILSVVDQIYSTTLVTPDGQDEPGRVWQDGDRCFVHEDAEKRIQMWLRAGLQTAFPAYVKVRREQPGQPGRLDLCVERIDPIDGEVTVIAVLELKVLRSFRSSGTPVPSSTNATAIDDGVRQAATYRNDRGAIWAALCCFDMRREPTGDSSFDDVRDLAARLDVELRLWFLFGSSRAWRRYTTSLP